MGNDTRDAGSPELAGLEGTVDQLRAFMRGVKPHPLLQKRNREALSRAIRRRRRHKAVDERAAGIMESVRSETIKLHLELVRAFA